jgi:hypothetical protein
MNLFQKNTRTPSSLVESEQDIVIDGVNNPNKTHCIKERAIAIANFIGDE